MRKILFAATTAGVLLLSACNTIHGIGRDVSSAGSAVSTAADDSKPKHHN